MLVSDVEKKFWEVDGVRIVVRAPLNQVVGNYTWVNAADQGWTLNEYIEKRVSSVLGDVPFIVVDGYGEKAHGGRLMKTVRESYRVDS